MMGAEGRDTRTRAEAAFQRWLDRFREDGEDAEEQVLAGEPADVRDEVRQMIADYQALRGRIGFGAPHIEAGRVIGDFRLVRELGRDGMAVVWEAEQLSLVRKVALKILLPHYSLSANALARFEREARAGGRLAHPGIVQTHAVGKADGLHYIAQELVAGGYTLVDSLADLRQERELPEGYYRRAAELFAKVAEALEHAHAHGVIHRDVKPSNILIGEKDEPRVTDFGLARIQDELALSRTGEIEGTPYYMSPEQAAGRAMGIDHRTDVFSLGSSLYEALTLARAFDGDTSQQVFQKILTVDPIDPRRLRSRVPRDLAVICLRALEKNPDRRYASMATFARDLRSWLDGRSIAARPVGSIGKGLRWARRHPVATLGAVSVLVLATVIGGLGSYSVNAKNRAGAERRARLAEEELRARSEEERGRLRRAEADRRMRERLLDLAAVVPLQGNRLDWQTSASWYLEAYREFGLPLDDGRQIAELVAAFDAVSARDPDLGREVAEGVHGLRAVFAGPTDSFFGLGGPEDPASLAMDPSDAFPGLVGSTYPEEPEGSPEARVRARMGQAGTTWLELWNRVIVLIDSMEARDPWRLSIWQAFKLYLGSGTDAFDPVLEPSNLEGRPGRDLAWLANLLLEPEFLSEQPFERVETAVDLYDRALDMGPDNRYHRFICHVQRGMCGLLSGKLVDPVHDLEIAVAIRPDSALAQLALSFAHKLAGSPQPQERAARKATEQEPGMALAWIMLGDARFWMRDYEGALLAFERAAELAPESGEPVRVIGDTLRAQGDLDGAITAYRASIELDPHHGPAYTNLVDALRAGGRQAEAEEVLPELLRRLDTAGEVSPEWAWAYHAMGGILIRKQDYAGAARAHRRAVELDPDNPLYNHNLAAAQVWGGELDEGIESARRAIELAPRAYGVPLSKGFIGLALTTKGRLGEASRLLKEAVQQMPENGWLRGVYVNALLSGGDVDGAAEQARAAFRELPPPWQAGWKQTLAWALTWSGDRLGALDAARECLQENPEAAHAHLGLANALEARPAT
jgi:tetratricopeptide (TPR) repeat protein